MSKLALFGGKKTVTLDYRKEATLPICTEAGIKEVNRLMEIGETSQSPVVTRFASRFASYAGASYALCTSNGTAALHSALFAVGVGPKDEVIVPSYTFWASVTPIIASHAIPVFCDVDKETFCLDPSEIVKHITARTKAIMVVHVWGNPCAMDSIMDIAKKYHLKVIEDCSHAHGASYHDVKVGVIGDVGCFSLQGTKTLPGGEGGILVTNNEEYYDRAVALGHYDVIPTLKDSSPYRKYALTGMGYKYRIHPFAAALANAALDHLDEVSAIRESNARTLNQGISDIPFLKPQGEYSNTKRVFSYHYGSYIPTTEHIKEPYALLKALSSEGVSCGYCGYGRLHTAPLFVEGGPFGDCKKDGESLKVTELLAHTTFLVAPRLEKSCDALINQYVDAYHKVAEHIDEVLTYAREQSFEKELAELSGRSIAKL